MVGFRTNAMLIISGIEIQHPEIRRCVFAPGLAEVIR